MNRLTLEEGLPKLNNKETISVLDFRLHHKCPWYRRWFLKGLPSYSLIEHDNGIGTRFDIICDVCGKMHDITDYDRW